MENINPSSSSSPISAAISDIEDPGSQPIVSILRELSQSPDGDAVADENTSIEKLAQYRPRDTTDDTAKILKAFIDSLPSSSKRVITKYVATREADDLYDLAYHLRTAVLIPMKAQGGKTPQVTPLPLSDIDLTRDNVASEMTQSSSRDHQQWLKATCLKRDNYKCVVTKLWDPIAETVVKLGEDDMTINTHLAHIIPFSMGRWENDRKRKEITQYWETLYLLFPGIKDVVKPTTINIPANGMTLMSAIHDDFGSLKIAFIPTDTEHTYKIKMYPGHQTFFRQYYQKLITFTQHGDSDLPSRVLLETHAVIAEILHASGQGEKIDELLRKWDDIRYLSSDGSTELQSLLSLLFSQYFTVTLGERDAEQLETAGFEASIKNTFPRGIARDEESSE